MPFRIRRLIIISIALLSIAGLTDDLVQHLPTHSHIVLGSHADGAEAAVSASNEVNTVPNKPEGLGIYVNDFGHLLTEQDSRSLQDHLQTLDASGIAQVSVLTVPATSRELAEFGPEIMNSWGIQHKGQKDGLLILVNAAAVKAHKTRGRIFVSTGYRIEGVLPDAKVGRILDETAIPAFEQNDYSKGILNATDALVSVLEHSPELRNKADRPSDSPNWLVILSVLFGLFFMSRRLQRRSRGMYSGGGPDFGGGYYGGGFSGNDNGGGFDGGFGGGDDSSGGGGAER